MRPWAEFRPDQHASAGRTLVRMDLACIFDHALADRDACRGSLPALLSLDGEEIRTLCKKWFPGIWLPDLDLTAPTPETQERDIATLLLWRAGLRSDETGWLAHIIARRAQEPHHLWEDLGLPNRDTLNRLMARHFPQISAARPNGMRWKKFLYRQICADPGHTLCPAPTCDACAEYRDCFMPG